VLLGAATGSAAADLTLAGRLLAVVLLDGCVASVCVLTAVLVRNTLGAVAAAVVIVAAAQIMALLGAGGWFPLSAPGLWAAQPRPTVGAELAVGLVGAVVVGVLATAATVVVWARRDIA
jgi:hypothetical protein